MGLSKSFMMAISSIISNKVRSLLTMLGIIIGIAAVIILVSLMNGLKAKITGIFSDFGTSSLTVMIRSRATTKEVKPDEMYDFVEANPELFNYASPNISVSGELKRPDSGDDTISGSVTGVSEDFNKMQNIKIAYGRFLSYADVKSRSRVAVIGSYEAVYFFDSCEFAIGQTMKINGTPYTIVGVIEESEDSEQASKDDIVYIPYTTAMQVSGTSVVSMYTVSAIDEDTVAAAKTKLEAFLIEKIGDSDYVNVTSLKAIIDQMTSMMGTMETVLVAIAGISLLVGGIGIMNIMLVSVSERTREIGIRKSLGAKHKHIMSQFVMESGVVSCIGGVLGIMLGSAISILAGKLLDMNVAPSVGAIFLAFSVSVGIGVVFGFLPARKAAKLNPIDALRSD